MVRMKFSPNKSEDGDSLQIESTWSVIPKTLSKQDIKHREKEHKGNEIKTTKYTILTFLPKNLFEQFHRFANVYFLFIIILNWIPAVNAFGKEIAMLPLIFVLAVTAIKDIIEDRQRYRSDKTVNNRLTDVYQCESDKFLQSKWKSIEVGDIVKLYNDEIIPADVLLLNSSDENGICHVSTANLDGENNLKQKQIPKGFLDDVVEFKASDVLFEVQCEQPNNQLHNFYGFMKKVLHKTLTSKISVRQNGEQVGIDKNNLLLRGCTLRNTEYAVGLVVYAGHDTKAMLNNSGPRYKRSRLEKDINKDIIACVLILFTLCLIGAIGCGVWTDEFSPFEKLMSTNEAEKPAYEGFLRFWTFIIVLQVIIPISLYVSVEIVKLGQVYFMNNDNQMFYADSSQYPICRATNINEDLGQIQYVFSDKTGTLTENKMIFKRFALNDVVVTHPEGENDEDVAGQCQEMSEKLWDDMGLKFQSDWDEFFTALTVCNTVVVSEQPTVDETLESSLETTTNGTLRRHSHQPNGSVKRNSLTPPQQNQNGGIRSHRTHTSPPNIIVERTLSHDKSQQETNDENIASDYLNISFPRARMYSKPLSDRLSRSIESINSWLNYGLTPKYEYESPDEGALVKAATFYGYKLASKTPEQVFFSTPNGDIKIFDILHVLQFDSARKRMSVIVRDHTGKIKVYSKGADTAIMLYLASGQDEIHEKTDAHLEAFAREGLRTLCVAKKDLSEEEYKSWLEQHKQAEIALTEREEKLAQSAEAIENNFQLLGATGIEDCLQDGVPETIASLRNAGIKVWILTGDKQETAVNIGFSCKLLDPNMEIITVNSHTKSDCNELLDQITQRINSKWPSYTVLPTTNIGAANTNGGRPPLALIIDGVTLRFALEKPLDKKFVNIAKHCESVVCCRATPLQKAAVVSLVRENLKVMTLSIGDGANDVSMLQMAEIGVGIAGQEGVQAVMASDFVLGRFRFLQRLLLLHGFWNYDRIARMIVYFFYKNAMFVVLLFWFNLYNGFSGSNALDDISLILYNLVFTSLPPIIGGVFDQSLPEQAVLRRPILYQWGQFGKAYTRKQFWVSILDAVYQSLVLFFVPYLSLREFDYDMLSIGILFHQAAVITATLHMAIETPNFTVLHSLIMIGSVAISFFYYFVLCAISPLIGVYWAIYVVMGTPEFWFLLIMTPLLALLPRFIFRILQTTFRPSVIQRVKRNLYKETSTIITTTCQPTTAHTTPQTTRTTYSQQDDTTTTSLQHQQSLQNFSEVSSQPTENLERQLSTPT